MEYSVTKRELSPQPVLVIRRRVQPSGIAPALAELLQRIFLYAQQTGTALAGQPFMRYLEWGPGLLTIEAGLPIAAPHSSPPRKSKAPEDGRGNEDISAGTLPGGLVAMTTHAGPYEKLLDAHAAIQVWIEAQGLATAGAPWESYVTDPADYPDPQDWKTEVFWPLAG
jgi:AraC family transcriptional regulator